MERRFHPGWLVAFHHHFGGEIHVSKSSVISLVIWMMVWGILSEWWWWWGWWERRLWVWGVYRLELVGKEVSMRIWMHGRILGVNIICNKSCKFISIILWRIEFWWPFWWGLSGLCWQIHLWLHICWIFWEKFWLKTPQRHQPGKCDFL